MMEYIKELEDCEGSTYDNRRSCCLRRAMYRCFLRKDSHCWNAFIKVFCFFTLFNFIPMNGFTSTSRSRRQAISFFNPQKNNKEKWAKEDKDPKKSPEDWKKEVEQTGEEAKRPVLYKMKMTSDTGTDLLQYGVDVKSEFEEEAEVLLQAGLPFKVTHMRSLYCPPGKPK